MSAQARKLRCWVVAVMLGLVPAAAMGQAAAPAAVPVPASEGPIPVTEKNVPLLAAARVQQVVDLAKAGYVEEEFFIRGTANVYDWQSDGRLTVRTPNAPYTTRILVRRPSDPARFSGNAVVEIFNNTRGYDWAFVWGLSHPHFLERGDAFVGVTQSPAGIDALKKFNPARYAPLSVANPTPAETCGPQNATSPSEEGLRWDIISQVGALLKSKPAAGPLAGFNVQRLYLTSHDASLSTYANAVHAHANGQNGRPIYDGYLVKTEVNPIRIRRCAAAPPDGDPRQVIRNVNVPVVRVMAEGDVMIGYSTRRPDSDNPNDLFRLYEIAGTPHMDKMYYQHMPLIQDQTAAGATPFLANWPLPNACAPPIDLLDFPLQRYAVNGAFANLDRWVRTGTPPRRAERMGIVNGGTPQSDYATDQYGNGVGGVRSPYVDVPAATYLHSSDGPGICRFLGRKVPFDWARMQSLYGSPEKYREKFVQSVDRLVKEQWYTESDGKRMKAEFDPTTLTRGPVVRSLGN